MNNILYVNYNMKEEYLNTVIDGKWYIENNIVHVDGNVYLEKAKIYNFIPVQFGICNGLFSCKNLYLTSLKGCPSTVNGTFNCSNNMLKTLEYSPQSIRGNFICSHNKLTTIKHSPVIHGNYYCNNNNLKNLDFCNKTYGQIICHNNPLTTLSINNIDTLSFNILCEVYPISYTYSFLKQCLKECVFGINELDLIANIKKSKNYNILKIAPITLRDNFTQTILSAVDNNVFYE